MAPQGATTELFEAGLAQYETVGRKSLFCVLGQSHTSHVKIFFKAVAVMILAEAKTMLLLVKVVMNNIALVIHRCDDDQCAWRGVCVKITSSHNC